MQAQNIPLNGTSATLPSDMITGMVRTDGGKRYVLVQNGTSASGTIADGLALMLLTGQTTTGVTTPAKVVITTGVTVPVYCVNNTGLVIPGDHYFWGLQQGAGYGLGGTIGDGVKFAPAANGLIGATADGLDTVCGVTISDVTTTVANRVHWNLPAGGVFDLA